MNSPLLAIKNEVSPPLQASKWLKYPILIDVEEMQALMAALGEFWIFPVGGISLRGEGAVPPALFLENYRLYIDSLKQASHTSISGASSNFSVVWTRTTEALHALLVGQTQQVIKVHHPVIQLQAHYFNYSSLDGRFRSMMKGHNNIKWGIQFSYPQIYQNEEMQIQKVADTPEFPNTALFKLLQQWIRCHTMATPFFIEAEQRQVNVPIRIGKNCLNWINNHPQLIAQGIAVRKNNSNLDRSYNG